MDAEAQRVILMRHKDARYPLHKYIGTHALTLYMAMQKASNSMDAGTILVSIYGHKPGAGLLLGVWRVKQRITAGQAIRAGLTQGSFEAQDPEWTGYYHDLEEMPYLADLRLKLEVTWPGRELAWRRILSKPRQKKPATVYASTIRTEPAVLYTGLTSTSLIMSELRLALQDLAWQDALRSSAGVYLITDEVDGRHYVGSAYGRGGFLGRWSAYAVTGHGNNQRLRELLAQHPGRITELRFTVLEPMPLSSLASNVIDRERYWKIALGSRAFGLNAN